MKRFFFLLFMLFISINSFEVVAQTKSSSTSSQQKKADKKKADQKKKQAKAELKAKHHQEKIQTKAVRKRMKKHRREASTPYRKPNFFQRLFHRKH